MWNKSIFIALILQLCDLSTSKTIPEREFKIEEWKLTLPNSSFLFQSNDQIVVVTQNKGYVSLSHVGDDDFCNIPTVSVTNGQVLGNGKLILFEKRNTNSNGEVRLKVLIVNPKDCSTRFVLNNYIAERDSQMSQLQIVSYYETFDIFTPNSDTCSPCRYDDRGQQVDLSYGLSKKVEGEVYENLLVKTIKEFDSSKGYFYALKYENGTSLMRFLNSKYEVMHEKLVDNEIISAYANNEGTIIACFVHRYTQGSVQSTCQHLDNTLRVVGQSGDHISRKNNLARVIIRPSSDDNEWMTVSVFQTKDDKNNTQRICMKLLSSEKRSVCNTIETPRFNFDIFVFPDKACYSQVNYYTHMSEIDVKCLISI